MNRFKNILLVVDPAWNNDAAVSLAASLAGRNRATLTLISVVEDPPPEVRSRKSEQSAETLFEIFMKDRQEQLRRLIESMDVAGITVKIQVVSGTPFLEIIRQVLRERHDLVILTASETAGLKTRLFGSMVMHLMRKCPCPVWAIKASSRKGFGRILAAVDPRLHDEQRRTLDRLVMDLATSLAGLELCELHVVHVWNLPNEDLVRSRAVMTEAELDILLQGVRANRDEQFRELLSHYSSLDPAPQVHLVKGQPGRKIPELVRQEGIDLLVMGTVSRTGVAGLFIGNTAETVLAQVDCSVLTVKPKGFVTPVTLEDG